MPEKYYIASDVEGTLASAEMWRAVASYQKSHGYASNHQRLILSNLPGILAYRLGISDPQVFRVRWTEKQAHRLAGWSFDEIDQLCKWVIEDNFWPNLRSFLVEELRQQQAEGAEIILASGMYQPMLERFAARLDFPVKIIGTRLEFKGDRFTGRFIGPVCNGEEKARRVVEITAGAPLLKAYGDSLSDVPLLQLSQQPVAVEPDQALAEHASLHGWQIYRGGKYA